MKRLPSSLGVATVLLLMSATDLVSQDRTCDLIDSQQVNSVTQGGGRVSHVARPRFLCTDGTRIEADSSVTFESNSFTQLFGNVLFRDGPQELVADRAQYFSQAGRIQAQGAVELRGLDDGSTITGENLIMLQSGDERPEDDMTMRAGRPHARFLSKAVEVSDPVPSPDSTTAFRDSVAEVISDPGAVLADSGTVPADSGTVPADSVTGEETEANAEDIPPIEPKPPGPPTPFEVDADVIRLVGDGLLQARGSVEMRQDSLLAYGDSMQYMEDSGVLTLFHDARILSPSQESSDTLDVRGDTIDLHLPNNRIDEIEARGHAHLVTETVDIRGPIVRIFFVMEELSRIVSVMGSQAETPEEPAGLEQPEDSLRAELPDPFARPQTTAEDFLLTGDSIEVRAPGGDLDSVVATGRAHGVTSGRGSINSAETPEFIQSDWIEGETITATFADNVDDSTAAEPGSASAGEGQSRYRLELLVAQGAARSFYRSAPDSTGTQSGPLELNYVRGEEIRLFMKDGEVDRMEVDNAKGAYFQPTVDPGPPRPDSMPTILPDTTGAPRGTGNTLGNPTREPGQ
jgi:hypothetical protein